MSYIDGFVVAVPTANKQKYIEHARLGDRVFTDLGATRVVECWGDDVPEGKVTDFSNGVYSVRSTNFSKKKMNSDSQRHFATLTNK